MESIEKLYAQIRQVIEDSRLIKIPREYGKAKNVVVNGMGASNLGARIVKDVFAGEIKVPIIVTPGYEVPAFVGKDTLYIMSSYSGGTEEPLSVYKEVKKRGAKILAIASKAKNPKKASALEKLMIKENIPGYLYQTDNNPAGAPRLGLGYGIFGTMTLLAKAGLFKIDVKNIERMVADLEIWDHELRPQVEAKKNIAKQIVSSLEGKQVIVTAAEFLEGNAQALRNQFCETGKNFASFLVLPELNHYSMEGLGFPKSNSNTLAFLFIDSELYSPRVQKRAELTKQVIRKNKIKVYDYKLLGRTKLEQAFEMLQLGSWVTFYLAMLNGVNPAPNPWVDWFKKELR